ncbi:MAG: hypothetical protein PF487_03180 [Bacteroidales bacterium]|jgi:hypothetical protein|nr:hypothetical protein [Bacteroidales bacterium]
MKTRFLLTIVNIFFLSLSLFAQPGNKNLSKEIGIRGGVFNGLTFKHFIDKENALEGIVTSRWEGIGFTGLYEKHKTAFETENLFWYYGGGAHLGFWNGDNSDRFDENRYYTLIGIDGIIGIEYYIKEVPINIGIDWKPCFNIIGNTGFWPDGGALSVRYVF